MARGAVMPAVGGSGLGGASSWEGQAIWERLPEESPKAYAAFRLFLELGEGRSYVEVARQRSKHESLIRRWASRFNWKQRAHACDLAQGREARVLLREERERLMRRQLRDLEQVQRIAMAGIAKLVVRDPVTGEARLDPAVTPEVAVRLYDLTLKMQRSLLAFPASEPAEAAPQDPLPLLPDAELEQLIALARERAGEQREKEKQGDGDDSKPQASQ